MLLDGCGWEKRSYNLRHRRSDDDEQTNEDAGNSAGKVIEVDEADELNEPNIVTVKDVRRYIREMRYKLRKKKHRRQPAPLDLTYQESINHDRKIIGPHVLPQATQ